MEAHVTDDCRGANVYRNASMASRISLRTSAPQPTMPLSSSKACDRHQLVQDGLLDHEHEPMPLLMDDP